MRKIFLSIYFIIYFADAFAGPVGSGKGHNADSTQGMPSNDFVTAVAILITGSLIFFVWRNISSRKK